MSIRWRLFLSYVVVIVALGIVLSLVVRSLAIHAVTNHVAAMGRGGMREFMTEEVRAAISAGVNQGVLWGALAALAAAVIASYLVSGWITRPLAHMADAAGKIAAGDFKQRVSHSRRDEIGRFAVAFNDMAGQLEQTEALRRELLGTISHEIRTPLATIEGYMQGLMDGVVPEEPETYDLVRREAARLSRLVTDIERLSRLEAGAEPISPQVMMAAEAVEAVAASLKPQFEAAGLSLDIDCSSPCPSLYADPDKFAQILGNLLSNSLRYTPQGGVVKIAMRGEGATVAFTVEDNGIGIPTADLPHVFERFYRVDKSRSSAGGGSGIGLAVVKALIEQMGGSVSAESAPGQYTRITFRLPRAT